MFGLRADGYSRRLWNLNKEGGVEVSILIDVLCLKKLSVVSVR